MNMKLVACIIINQKLNSDCTDYESSLVLMLFNDILKWTSTKSFACLLITSCEFVVFQFWFTTLNAHMKNIVQRKVAKCFHLSQKASSNCQRFMWDFHLKWCFVCASERGRWKIWENILKSSSCRSWIAALKLLSRRYLWQCITNYDGALYWDLCKKYNKD